MDATDTIVIKVGTLEAQLLTLFRRLSATEQAAIVEAIADKATQTPLPISPLPKGTLAKDVFDAAAAANFAPEDLAEMKHFIEQEFEQIDWNEWQ